MQLRQSDLLLKTKLIPPRLISNYVSRKALFARLDQGLEQKLTLVSAPAGYGKTTLIASWLKHVNLPAAWLSLDPDDRDFTRFLTYLIAALQTIFPQTGTNTLGLLEVPPLPPNQTLLTHLVNNLTTIQEKFILVLDNYHAIECEKIDQALTFFIDHLPPKMHLVVISRVDPLLSLSQLRAKGQLDELRSADLSFSPSEASEFFRQMTDLDLTGAEVTALDQRTEGWIAGLQMAALSLRKREAESAAEFIEDFCGSHRYIMDYLVDEVLQGLPEKVHRFLLFTSILDRLCSSLCEAVISVDELEGGGDGLAKTHILAAGGGVQDILFYLEQNNLFIYSLDDQRYWFRYHSLFADLLRHRLQQIYPDRVAKLHLKASEWYEREGLIDAAVHHALAVKAFGRAADLIEQTASGMIQRSELTRLINLIDIFPEEELQARPLLGLYYCWSLLLGGQTQQAAAHLSSIESGWAAGDTEQYLLVQGHTAALRAYLMRETGDFSTAVALSRQALAQLPSQETLLCAMVTLNLAIVHYLEGEFQPASQLLEEIIAAGQTSQLLANTLSAIYLYAQILKVQGELTKALQLCHDGLAFVTRHGWQNYPAVGFVYVALGELYRERNELKSAQEYLDRGVKLGMEGGHPHILIIGNIWLAWLRHTIGDIPGSQESIRDALQLVQRHQVSRYWPIPSAASYQARLSIAQGNRAAADHWEQALAKNQTDRPIKFLYEAEDLTLARLWLVQGNLRRAESMLIQLQEEAELSGRNGSLIEIRILQSITLDALNKSDDALTALAQALRLAEQEGYIQVFLDEGEPLLGYLRLAAARDLQTPFALRLLTAFKAGAPVVEALVEPLSERELEILRYLAAGYSNQDIAQELVLAVSTVKKHISNIYGKLEVGSRTQAVARARTLGYL